MKEIVPETPPPIVENRMTAIQQRYQKYVVPSYGRFDLALSRGQGRYVWDVHGRRYLDLGSGIAVCALGHAHPAISKTLFEQSQRLIHTSNLYYHEPQADLAEALVRLIGPGKVFFCNSGAEANEGLYKLARRFGHDEGRFEVITAINSFHGRTLAGIAATGQEKVKKGFEPAVPGFRHVPYNDLDAVRQAISPATAAVLIEGIQGEGGITPARIDYLLGLRQLCQEFNLLLFMDSVQCGHFRTGCYQSYQTILAGVPEGERFLPDAISMAKSLGGGFPMGAFWVRAPYADLLGAGSHGTTFGGTPLACAVALKVLEVIEQDRLVANVRKTGTLLRQGLERLTQVYPCIVRSVRGLGFMLGLELADRSEIPGFAKSEKSAATQFVECLHTLGVLTIPSGSQIVRLLPPLNLSPSEAEEALNLFEKAVQTVAKPS